MRQETVCRYSRHQIDQEVTKAAVTAVFHLADVFQTIINRFYDRPFPQQELVFHVHHNVFHMLSQLAYQWDSLPIQALKQGLRALTPVPEAFPVQFAAQPDDDVKVPLVNGAGCTAQAADFPTVVANQVPFEAVKPHDTALSPRRPPCEHFMAVHAPVMAHLQDGGVATNLCQYTFPA